MDIEEIKGFLHQLGYRLTPQRLRLIEVVAGSEGHISAEEVYAQLHPHFPKVHISTIYRNLELLKRLGVVTETDLGEGRLRYHFREKGHHHHLICHGCGAIIELDEALLSPLKDVLQERYGFKADLRHLAIFGYCSQCRG
jgi:Fur family ferric uptake transcriptional regulator